MKGLWEPTRESLQIKNVNHFACWQNHNTAPTFDITVFAWLRDNGVRDDSRDSFSIEFLGRFDTLFSRPIVQVTKKKLFHFFQGSWFQKTASCQHWLSNTSYVLRTHVMFWSIYRQHEFTVLHSKNPFISLRFEQIWRWSRFSQFQSITHNSCRLMSLKRSRLAHRRIASASHRCW